MKWYGMVVMAIIAVSVFGGVVYMEMNIDKFVNEKNTKNVGINPLISKADTAYHVESNYVESLKIYRQIIEIQPTNAVALNGAGHSLVKLNQNADAIEYFDTVLSIDGVNVSARVGIGNALYNMEKPDEAVYHYTQALLQSDTHIDAMLGMAASMSDLEKYDESLLWVDKILEMDPDNSDAISIQLKLKNIQKQNIDPAVTKLLGIAYSAYRAGQSPITGPHPSVDDIDNDLQFLSSITDKIRVYGLDGDNQFIPEIAQKYGIKIAVTLMLTGDETDQDRIERGISLANQYPDTNYTMIVENEKLYRETMDEAQIIQYIE